MFANLKPYITLSFNWFNCIENSPNLFLQFMMVATCISHDEAIFPKIIDHSGNLPSHRHIVHVQGVPRYHQVKTIRDTIFNPKLL